MEGQKFRRKIHFIGPQWEKHLDVSRSLRKLLYLELTWKSDLIWLLLVE